ncbi:MAG: GH3 family domain-containing protein [Candidatus Thorarchaeota archaeon]
MSIMRKLVSTLAKRKASEIEHILNHPVEVSEEKLMSILNRHWDTVIGRKYGFDMIKTPEQFSDRVPLCDYYTLEPYLKRVHENPRGKILTSDDVIWYLQSSGSSGEPKRLPVTAAGSKDLSAGTMTTWFAWMNRNPENTRMFDGTIVTMGAPAEIDHINGIPVGYATGAMIRRLNPLFKRLMKPGEDVFNITDIELKMRAYARLLATVNVTGLQGITTLILSLVRRMQNEYGPWLVDEFKGTKHEKRLREAMNDDGTLDVETLWPNLTLFTLMGIDCSPYLEWIKRTLPQASMLEMYGASEGYLGGQLVEGPGVQLLAHVNYFEFIPEEESHLKNPTVVPLSDVKRGKRYEIVITNNFGYYRYRIGDLVTFINTDPYTIAEIGRKGRIVNLAGEKLSDKHITRAMTEACRKTKAEITDYTVVGVVSEGLPHYTIAAMFQNSDVDTVDFVQSFEEAMSRINYEFAHSRETGGLGPTLLARMKTSAFEDKVKASHIQAKPDPLTTNMSILEACEIA